MATAPSKAEQLAAAKRQVQDLERQIEVESTHEAIGQKSHAAVVVLNELTALLASLYDDGNEAAEATATIDLTAGLRAAIDDLLTHVRPRSAQAPTGVAGTNASSLTSAETPNKDGSYTASDPTGPQGNRSVTSPHLLHTRRRAYEFDLPDEDPALAPRPRPLIDQLRDVVGNICEDRNNKFVIISCHFCGANAPTKQRDRSASYRFDLMGLRKHYANAHSCDYGHEATLNTCKKVALTSDDAEEILAGRIPQSKAFKAVYLKDKRARPSGTETVVGGHRGNIPTVPRANVPTTSGQDITIGDRQSFGNTTQDQFTGPRSTSELPERPRYSPGTSASTGLGKRKQREDYGDEEYSPTIKRRSSGSDF